MKQRINIRQLEPKAFELLLEMEKNLSQTGLPLKLRELIKIRASQINKCARCITLHTTDARKEGETEQRIYALPAWEESPLFTEEERSVLALTDEITRISEQGVRDETFQNAQKYFTENQIAQIILVVCQINVWNRINVSTKTP